MNYVGDYHSGATVMIYFNTFDSNDPSASVTMTDFVNTDVHIHKDDNLTQRNNAAGVTVDVDVDGIAGCHLIKIDTSDNTVADFFVPGHDYGVRIEGVTVDAATLNPFVGHFSIENRYTAGLLTRSNIATLASQTSFTLESGEASADDDAYNGCVCIVTDVATMVQKCIGYISDYTGSTRTVTLAADPGVFTMAAGDHVAITAPVNVEAWDTNAVTASSGNPDINVESMDASVITSSVIAADAIGASQIAANAIGASELATDAVNEIVDQVWDEAQADHTTADTFGALATEITTIDDFVDTEIADIQARLPAALISGRMDSTVSAINDNTDAATALALSADTIVVGKVDNTAFTATTTILETDIITTAAADHYNGRIIIFTSGTLQNQATDISDYSLTGGRGRFTYTAVTSAPADDVDFIIV